MMQTKVLGHRTDLITIVMHVPTLRVLSKRKLCFHPTKMNSKVYYKGKKSAFREALSILYTIYCLIAMQSIITSTSEVKIKLKIVISNSLNSPLSQTAPFWFPQVNMQFLQLVLLLLACQKCSVYTKILYVRGVLVVLLCCRKKPTRSSAVKKICTRTIQNHRH